MGRARDLANILSSSGNVALDSEMGLSLITPTSIATTGGSGSISSSGGVSFTSASAISLNDVFSATYTNYRILIDTDASEADAGLQMRLRVSGTDNTSSNYRFGTGYLTTSGAATFSGQNSAGLATSWRVLAVGSAGRAIACHDIFNPFSTEETGFVGGWFQISTNGFSHFGSGNMSVTTSYTGFTLFPTAGTITGTVSVYGYNK
jgi:hypothetical protein